MWLMQIGAPRWGFYSEGDCWQLSRFPFVCHCVLSLPPAWADLTEVENIWPTGWIVALVTANLVWTSSGWTMFLLPHSSLQTLSPLTDDRWLGWVGHVAVVCSLSFQISFLVPQSLSYIFPSSTILCLSDQRDDRLLNLLCLSKMFYFEVMC